MTGRQPIGHLIERQSETTDLRCPIFEVSAGLVIAVAPFGGHLEQSLDGTAEKFSTTRPCRVNRCDESGDNQSETAIGRAVDCCERLGLPLPCAGEQISRRQRERHVSGSSTYPADACLYFPTA